MRISDVKCSFSLHMWTTHPLSSSCTPTLVFHVYEGSGEVEMYPRPDDLLNDVHEVSSVLFMLIAHVTVCGGGQDLLSTHV